MSKANAFNVSQYKPDVFFSSNPPCVTEILANRKFFICGAGGLGSNVAITLARAGAGCLYIADFDRVEPSNLNRQQYYRDQVGKFKVDALEENLLRINPFLRIIKIFEKITSDNCGRLIPQDADVIFECFDKAETKAMLASFCLRERPAVPLITVSGTAGMGDSSEIKIKKGVGKLWIVGDGKTEMNRVNGTIASRVAQVAAMQAHIGICLVLGLE